MYNHQFNIGTRIKYVPIDKYKKRLVPKALNDIDKLGVVVAHRDKQNVYILLDNRPQYKLNYNSNTWYTWHTNINNIKLANIPNTQLVFNFMKE